MSTVEGRHHLSGRRGTGWRPSVLSIARRVSREHPDRYYRDIRMRLIGARVELGHRVDWERLAEDRLRAELDRDRVCAASWVAP